MKAIKNHVEADGMKRCHIRDGVALCKYFAWLENAILSAEYVTEISGADKLEEFRKFVQVLAIIYVYNYIQILFKFFSGKVINLKD